MSSSNTVYDNTSIAHNIELRRRELASPQLTKHSLNLPVIGENWVNVEIIVGILLLIKAIILGIQNILEVLLEDIGIPKMESIFLHTNITIIPHSVLYVSLSYYIINPCTSASSNFDDSFL
ncbi:HN1_G0014610.mRNA.1.CDS.1 [Saccharomyces cerevisiae]|nr:HN1_G0014610.mRNA.1.CDS.1 [Saccharomyces cerevisiae]